jgi:DNA-binding protein HU-beta
MSKAQLVKNVASKTGFSQQQVSDFINAFCDAVQDSVANDEAVTIVGFGTFYLTRREASTGRNPRTGEPIKIKASNQPKFRAGKRFKEAANS